MRKHDVPRLVAQVIGGKRCHGFCVENGVDRKCNGGAAPGETLHYDVGVLDGGYNHGNIGALGDFESAAAEGKQIAVLAAGALGVNAHGGYIALDEVCALEDGLERLAVVFSVNRQEKVAGNERLGDGDLEYGRFCNEGKLMLPQRPESGNGVEHGTMIAHKQPTGIGGDEPSAFHLYLYAEKGEDDARHYNYVPTIKFAAGVIFLLRIGAEGDDQKKQNIQQEPGDKKCDDHQRYGPKIIGPHDAGGAADGSCCYNAEEQKGEEHIFQLRKYIYNCSNYNMLPFFAVVCQSLG